jgi:hypothetical protein
MMMMIAMDDDNAIKEKSKVCHQVRESHLASTKKNRLPWSLPRATRGETLEAAARIPPPGPPPLAAAGGRRRAKPA